MDKKKGPRELRDPVGEHSLQAIRGVLWPKKTARFFPNANIRNIPRPAFVDDMRQSAREQIEIRIDDLGDVAGKDHFRSLAGAANECLRLFAVEVLRLVQHQKSLVQLRP